MTQKRLTEEEAEQFGRDALANDVPGQPLYEWIERNVSHGELYDLIPADMAYGYEVAKRVFIEKIKSGNIEEFLDD